MSELPKIEAKKTEVILTECELELAQIVVSFAIQDDLKGFKEVISEISKNSDKPEKVVKQALEKLCLEIEEYENQADQAHTRRAKLLLKGLDDPDRKMDEKAVKLILEIWYSGEGKCENEAAQAQTRCAKLLHQGLKVFRKEMDEKVDRLEKKAKSLVQYSYALQSQLELIEESLKPGYKKRSKIELISSSCEIVMYIAPLLVLIPILSTCNTLAKITEKVKLLKGRNREK